jgi:dTDP-4-dehydrorhamnose reductase
MLRLGREREVIQVVDDQYGCPTYAADLAETILRIAAQFLQGGQVHWGTYHYCGKGVTSWHGFAEEIFRLASEYESLMVKRVEPISTSEYPTPAKRPANSILDCSVLEKTFGIHPQPWVESLAHMLEVLFSVEKSKNS